jgi:hypothetical protein
VLGRPGVWAWELPETFSPSRLDLTRYRTLLLRAAESVLQPFGISAAALELWMEGGAAPLPLPWGEVGGGRFNREWARIETKDTKKNGGEIRDAAPVVLDGAFAMVSA